MTKKAYTKNEDNEYNKKNIIPELFPIKLSEAFFNKSELIFRKKKLSKQTEYFVIEYIYIYLKWLLSIIIRFGKKKKKVENKLKYVEKLKTMEANL